MDCISLRENMSLKRKKVLGLAGVESEKCHYGKKRNHIGLYVHEDSVRSKVF